MTDVQSVNTVMNYLPYLGAATVIGAGALGATEYYFRRARAAAQIELGMIGDAMKGVLESSPLFYFHHRLSRIVGDLSGEDYDGALRGMDAIVTQLQPQIGDEIIADVNKRRSEGVTPANNINSDTGAADLSRTLDKLFDSHQRAKTMPLYARARWEVIDFVSSVRDASLLTRYKRNKN